MRVLQISACDLRFAYIHATVYIFVFIRSFAPEIFFHTEKKYSKRGRALLRRVRFSFTSIRGAARWGEARARAICLRLYLLYSVACQPIYIGLDSAFTSRATGTRPEEHRRAARFSLTISVRLIFAKLHPRARQARFTRARARPSPSSSTLELRRLLVHVALVKRDAAFLHKGAIVISCNLENAYLRVFRWPAKTSKRYPY